jgi:hypothetical protein
MQSIGEDAGRVQLLHYFPTFEEIPLPFLSTLLASRSILPPLTHIQFQGSLISGVLMSNQLSSVFTLFQHLVTALSNGGG